MALAQSHKICTEGEGVKTRNTISEALRVRMRKIRNLMVCISSYLF
jgi:hypothetical protein